MSLPADFLDQLRSRVSLAGVIGRRVKLTRKGKEHMGLCPFHNEKSPSFSVVEDKGFYHCFGCGAHGDVLSFVMQTEGLSFPEAVEKLAGEAGLEVPKASPRARAEAEERQGLGDVVELACRFFQAELAAPGGQAGRRYLEGRGLKPETLAAFRLGFAPGRRGALATALKAQGIAEAQLIEAGLAKRPEGEEEGSRLREYFFDRVIFPIEDRRGRVVAFGGRTLGDGQPKYLNSPDSALFHKGRLLYNLARARQAVRDGQPLLVVEGYMDVIALAESGIGGAVAPLGTAVTEDQIGELWRLADAPILCLDGDNAGRRAALRAAERALPLLQPGKTLRFAFLPAGEDPDSLVRQSGRAAFDQVLGAARPLAEMVWQKELAEQPADGPEAWAALKGRLLAAAGRIQHPEVQRLYRDDLVDRFYAARREARGLGQGGGRQGGGGQGGGGQGGGARGAPGQRRFGPGGFGPGRAPAQQRAAKPRAEGLLQRRDTLLLALVINHPHLLAEFLEEMAAVPLAAAHQRLRQGVIDSLAETPDLDSDGLTRHLSSLGLGEALAKVLAPAVYAFCAAARPEASLDLARQTLEGLLADVAAGEAARAVDEAERRLAADPSEENLARMAAAVRLMREAEARRGGADTA